MSGFDASARRRTPSRERSLTAQRDRGRCLARARTPRNLEFKTFRKVASRPGASSRSAGAPIVQTWVKTRTHPGSLGMPPN